MTTVDSLDVVERLAALNLDGSVVLPSSPGWDTARAAWQLTRDQRPLAVVRAGSESDVAAVLLLASESGLRVAPQSTGHGAIAVGDLSDAILLRTTALDGVSIDPVARTATVGAGATWGAVAASAAGHSLACLHGSSPSTGVVGLAIAGGVGWLGRLHGLTSGSIVSARVALPDGTITVASATENPDLWWLLRGGGGAGIVTELTIQLFEHARIAAGTLWWHLDDARRVLNTWAAWIATVPDEVTSVARMMRFPDIDMLPPHLRGQAFTLVQVAVCEPADADELLAPLRALSPFADDVAVGPPTALGPLAMDPPIPTAACAEGELLPSLSQDALDAWIGAALAPEAGGLLAADLRQLGGRMRTTDEPGAVTSLDAEVAAVGIAMVNPMTGHEGADASVHAMLEAVRPWMATSAYANFREGTATPDELYGAHATRVAQIRTALDPHGVVLPRHM